MNRNIFYFNKQNKTQPSRTKTREQLTKRNRLMVPDKNEINKINSHPLGHFFTLLIITLAWYKVIKSYSQLLKYST